MAHLDGGYGYGLLYLVYLALAGILAGISFSVFSSLLTWPPYFIWLAAINATTALMYALDKFLAVIDGPRMPEFVGLLLPILGGFVGGWLTMFFLRYKTQHKEFWLVQFLGLILHSALFYFTVLPGL